MKKGFWNYGEQKELADMAGTFPSYLSELLHKKKEASAQMAKRLEACSVVVLGQKRKIPIEAWIFAKTTSHPAFNDTRKK